MLTAAADQKKAKLHLAPRASPRLPQHVPGRLQDKHSDEVEVEEVGNSTTKTQSKPVRTAAQDTAKQAERSKDLKAAVEKESRKAEAKKNPKVREWGGLMEARHGVVQKKLREMAKLSGSDEELSEVETTDSEWYDAGMDWDSVPRQAAAAILGRRGFPVAPMQALYSDKKDQQSRAGVDADVCSRLKRCMPLHNANLSREFLTGVLVKMKRPQINQLLTDHAMSPSGGLAGKLQDVHRLARVIQQRSSRSVRSQKKEEWVQEQVHKRWTRHCAQAPP